MSPAYPGTSGSFHFLTQAGCPNIFLAAKSVSPLLEKANAAADHRGTKLLLACPLPQALPPAFSPHYPLLAPLQHDSCGLVLSGNCQFPQLCPCCVSALSLLSALSLFSFSHFLSGTHCLFFLLLSFSRLAVSALQPATLPNTRTCFFLFSYSN